MKSIQTKILSVVILGLLVITAIVSAIGVSMTHEIMHKDADRILNNVALKEAAYINDALGDISKSAAIMKHYAQLEIENTEQLADEVFRNEYLQNTKLMFTEIALNTDGIKGYFYRMNPQFTNGTTGYYNLVEENGTLREMPVTDLNKFTEADVQNVRWYYTPVLEGKAVWLDPYYFPGYDKLMISYTIPLYVNSELLGVIGFNMDFEYLLARINDITVYEEGCAILLAEDGQTRYNQKDRAESDEPHTKATATLKNGMYLELRADYEDIQRDTRPMLTKIVNAFLIVLAGAIIYTIFVTYRIVQPLKQLTIAAEKIASGDISEPEWVAEKSKDEIGTLSRVLRNAYEKIQEYNVYINALAYRDALTGVKNSTAYVEATAKLNQEITCGNPQFGVLMVDINNLKETNDHYGHDVGDELIVHTAKILTEVFRTSGVYRVGGDEFVVLLAGRDYEHYRMAMNCLDELCAKDYITVNDDRVPVSIARGVAIFDPAIDRVYKDVFAKADHAMYMNKEMSKAPAL